MNYEKEMPLRGSLITNDLEIDEQAANSNNYKNKEADSCIEGLNDRGILSSYLICLITGVIVQLFSFDSNKHEFFYWFVFGNILIFCGFNNKDFLNFSNHLSKKEFFLQQSLQYKLQI